MGEVGGGTQFVRSAAKHGMQKRACIQTCWQHSGYEAQSSTVPRCALPSVGAQECACVEQGQAWEQACNILLGQWLGAILIIIIIVINK